VSSLLAGCDFGFPCTSGDDGPRSTLVSVVEIGTSSSDATPRLLGTFGDADGIQADVSRLDLVSVRGDGRALLIEDSYRAEKLFKNRDGFDSLPDSLGQCVFAPLDARIVCQMTLADTLADDTQREEVERARSALFSFATLEKSPEVLFANQAGWSDEDKYRITSYGSPTFSANGEWLAVWSQRETRQLIRNADSVVTREIRFATDTPQIVLREMCTGIDHIVAGPLLSGPFESAPGLVVSSEGRFVGVVADKRVFIVDMGTGALVASADGEQADFSPSSHWLASLSSDNPGTLHLTPLPGDDSIPPYVVSRPQNIISFAFLGTEDQLFFATSSDVISVIAGMKTIEPTITLEALKPVLKERPEATIDGSIVGLFASPHTPDKLRIMTDYYVFFPSGCE